MLRNASYSLRSFARDLGIPAPRMSEILNNKRGTTLEKAQLMAKNLFLNKLETKRFILSVEALHSRSKKRAEQAQEELLDMSRKDEVNFLSEDKFAIIASWYHYAILELLSTDIGDISISEIARRLNITNLQAKHAIDRLEKLNLIQHEQGRFKVLSETSFTTNDIPSHALKQHHEEHLKKAIRSLYEDDVSSREIGSTTLAIDKEQVGEFKELIRDFRRKIAAMADNSKNKDSVYLLGTQLFRLDREMLDV